MLEICSPRLFLCLWMRLVSPTRWSPLSRNLYFCVGITVFTGRVLGPSSQVLNTLYSKLSHTMKEREHWSLVDGVVLRRRRSVQAAIDQFLDQLVDIFDFPVAPPSYSAGSLSVPHPTRKDPAEDVYMTMEEAISHSRECTVGNCPKQQRRVSMADRVRELLLRSSRSKTSTRSSVAICNSTKSNNFKARTLQMPWLSEERKTPTEPQDALWVERDENDRQLQCGYQTLADEG